MQKYSEGLRGSSQWCFLTRPGVSGFLARVLEYVAAQACVREYAKCPQCTEDTASDGKANKQTTYGRVALKEPTHSPTLTSQWLWSLEAPDPAKFAGHTPQQDTTLLVSSAPCKTMPCSQSAFSLLGRLKSHQQAPFSNRLHNPKALP